MIDLHLHFDGSLLPETVLKLAKSQGIRLPADTREELIPYLTAPDDCQSLNEYLEKFQIPLQVLQTEAALKQAASELIKELGREGLLYVEIRFAPQLHLEQGLNQKKVIQAVLDGVNQGIRESRKEGGRIFARLILCCMRGKENQRENEETVRLAAEFIETAKHAAPKEASVAAVDLAGAEALFPTGDFGAVFDLAKRLEVPYTIHAGEADGPESVRAALAMGTGRIGHGVRCVADEQLVGLIKEQGVTLECCVISNIQTKAVALAKEHPLLPLLRQGVLVTVNTDNMTVSSTSIQKEFALLRTLGMTKEEERRLLLNSVEAAFLTESEKEELKQALLKALV